MASNYFCVILSAMAKRKNPAAVALGRKGGKKKVAKGFSTMDPKRRAEIAKAAAAKRWEKKDEKE
jgi:hypothetical protein